MRTDDLLHALAADHEARAAPLERVLALALAAGLAIALVMFAVILGPRADIAEAVDSPRFLMKFVETGALALTAVILTLRLMRPGTPGTASILTLAVGPVILALAVGVELMLVPASDWMRRLVGTNMKPCLASIPLLAVPVFISTLLAMRHGAPTRPRFAGAMAGLLAGGFAATLYAAHCIDDSPLFVAAWYSVGIALMTLAGYLLGPRVLRW